MPPKKHSRSLPNIESLQAHELPPRLEHILYGDLNPNEISQRLRELFQATTIEIHELRNLFVDNVYTQLPPDGKLLVLSYLIYLTTQCLRTEKAAEVGLDTDLILPGSTEAIVPLADIESLNLEAIQVLILFYQLAIIDLITKSQGSDITTLEHITFTNPVDSSHALSRLWALTAVFAATNPMVASHDDDPDTGSTQMLSESNQEQINRITDLSVIEHAAAAGHPAPVEAATMLQDLEQDLSVSPILIASLEALIKLTGIESLATAKHRPGYGKIAQAAVRILDQQVVTRTDDFELILRKLAQRLDPQRHLDFLRIFGNYLVHDTFPKTRPGYKPFRVQKRTKLSELLAGRRSKAYAAPASASAPVKLAMQTISLASRAVQQGSDSMKAFDACTTAAGELDHHQLLYCVAAHELSKQPRDRGTALKTLYQVLYPHERAKAEAIMAILERGGVIYSDTSSEPHQDFFHSLDPGHSPSKLIIPAGSEITCIIPPPAKKKPPRRRRRRRARPVETAFEPVSTAPNEEFAFQLYERLQETPISTELLSTLYGSVSPELLTARLKELLSPPTTLVQLTSFERTTLTKLPPEGKAMVMGMITQAFRHVSGAMTEPGLPLRTDLRLPGANSTILRTTEFISLITQPEVLRQHFIVITDWLIPQLLKLGEIVTIGQPSAVEHLLVEPPTDPALALCRAWSSYGLYEVSHAYLSSPRLHQLDIDQQRLLVNISNHAGNAVAVAYCQTHALCGEPVPGHTWHWTGKMDDTIDELFTESDAEALLVIARVIGLLQGDQYTGQYQKLRQAAYAPLDRKLRESNPAQTEDNFHQLLRRFDPKKYRYFYGVLGAYLLHDTWQHSRVNIAAQLNKDSTILELFGHADGLRSTPPTPESATLIFWQQVLGLSQSDPEAFTEANVRYTICAIAARRMPEYFLMLTAAAYYLDQGNNDFCAADVLDEAILPNEENQDLRGQVRQRLRQYNAILEHGGIVYTMDDPKVGEYHPVLYDPDKPPEEQTIPNQAYIIWCVPPPGFAPETDEVKTTHDQPVPERPAPPPLPAIETLTLAERLDRLTNSGRYSEILTPQGELTDDSRQAVITEISNAVSALHRVNGLRSYTYTPEPDSLLHAMGLRSCSVDPISPQSSHQALIIMVMSYTCLAPDAPTPTTDTVAVEYVLDTATDELIVRSEWLSESDLLPELPADLTLLQLRDTLQPAHEHSENILELYRNAELARLRICAACEQMPAARPYPYPEDLALPFRDILPWKAFALRVEALSADTLQVRIRRGGPHFDLAVPISDSLPVFEASSFISCIPHRTPADLEDEQTISKLAIAQLLDSVLNTVSGEIRQIAEHIQSEHTTSEVGRVMAGIAAATMDRTERGYTLEQSWSEFTDPSVQENVSRLDVQVFPDHRFIAVITLTNRPSLQIEMDASQEPSVNAEFLDQYLQHIDSTLLISILEECADLIRSPDTDWQALEESEPDVAEQNPRELLERDIPVAAELICSMISDRIQTAAVEHNSVASLDQTFTRFNDPHLAEHVERLILRSTPELQLHVHVYLADEQGDFLIVFDTNHSDEAFRFEGDTIPDPYTDDIDLILVFALFYEILELIEEAEWQLEDEEPQSEIHTAGIAQSEYRDPDDPKLAEPTTATELVQYETSHHQKRRSRWERVVVDGGFKEQRTSTLASLLQTDFSYEPEFDSMIPIVTNYYGEVFRFAQGSRFFGAGIRELWLTTHAHPQEGTLMLIHLFPSSSSDQYYTLYLDQNQRLFDSLDNVSLNRPLKTLPEWLSYLASDLTHRIDQRIQRRNRKARNTIAPRDKPSGHANAYKQMAADAEQAAAMFETRADADVAAEIALISQIDLKEALTTLHSAPEILKRRVRQFFYPPRLAGARKPDKRRVLVAEIIGIPLPPYEQPEGSRFIAFATDYHTLLSWGSRPSAQRSQVNTIAGNALQTDSACEDISVDQIEDITIHVSLSESNSFLLDVQSRYVLVPGETTVDRSITSGASAATAILSSMDEARQARIARLRELKDGDSGARLDFSIDRLEALELSQYIRINISAQANHVVRQHRTLARMPQLTRMQLLSELKYDLFGTDSEYLAEHQGVLEASYGDGPGQQLVAYYEAVNTLLRYLAPTDSVERRVSEQAITGESMDISEWRIATREWSAVARAIVRLLCDRSFAERHESLQRMFQVPFFADEVTEQFWQLTMDITSLSDQALHLLLQAIEQNEAQGIYPVSSDVFETNAEIEMLKAMFATQEETVPESA